jgi:hypothetical protein
MVVEMQEHPDKEVQAAIVRLADALCTFERATGIENVMIIREKGGFVFRAISGKPVPTQPYFPADEDLLNMVS